MEPDVLGWVVFWLTVAQLPFFVALRRILRGQKFRILNRWILYVGLGQIYLPLAAACLLAIGFPPYAQRAEERLRFVVMFWLASFGAMWLLFLVLGLACFFRPERAEGAGDPGARPKRAWARLRPNPWAGACVLGGMLAIVFVRIVELPPDYQAAFYVIAAGAFGLGLSLVVRAYRRQRGDGPHI